MVAKAPTLPEGYRAIVLDSVDSTMVEARRRAGAGEASGLWIVARRQTAGRGRRGRLWVSQPGNLYATLLLRDPAPRAQLGELCFVAGVALHEAVRIACPATMDAFRDGKRSGSDVDPITRSLCLKWPNDLHLDGAKLAGILIEGEDVGGVVQVAVGFGVNCTHHPDEPGHPAVDLASAGVHVTPLALFESLAVRMAHWLAAWRQGSGFAEVRAAWLARAMGLGEPIVVRLSDRTLEGVFDSLDERGQLLLRLSSGVVRPVAAGEIFFAGAR
jgi:BirA family biotin operon repressor/biotin-[acetyl-CoA-carboxylase] ligase